MSRVNYIICAAGKGERFKTLIPGKSKPEIILNGKSLLSWSISSLPLEKGDKVILVTQKNDSLKSKLSSELTEFFYVDFEWIEIDYYTKGQLDTALLGLDVISNDEPVVIYNADTFFVDKKLNFRDVKVDGVIPCSKQPGDCWSFCGLDEKGKVVEVTEKKRISEYASIGLYYFRNKKLILDNLDNYLSLNEGENYVAPLYNLLIEKGHSISMELVNSFYPMGTPRQVNDYWKVSDDSLLNQNQNSPKVLVVDLDNTITIEDPKTPYSEKEPNLKLIEKLREYKELGFEIVLHTARRMRTHKNNEAKVVASMAKVTYDWLDRYEVPYDGLKFGKPYAENAFYIDDRAIRPDEFLKLSYQEIMDMLK